MVPPSPQRSTLSLGTKLGGDQRAFDMAAAPAPAPAAAVEPDDEPTSSIPIKTFNPDTNDFQEWISLFEDAVVLATNVKKEARKKELFKTWLPLVLDDQTCIIFRRCEKKDWEELKKELAKLLVDPQERYEWRSGRLKITWDHSESFHVLAARVKRAINKYEDEPRPCDFFHHFRTALPADYIQAIDLGANAETIDEAIRVALRFRTAQSGKKNVTSFTAASMSSDRINDLECALERMSVTLENVEEETRQLQKRVKQLENLRRYPRDDDWRRDDYEKSHREYNEDRVHSRSHAHRDDESGCDYYDHNRRKCEEDHRSHARENENRDDGECRRPRRDDRADCYDDFAERYDYRRRDGH